MGAARSTDGAIDSLQTRLDGFKEILCSLQLAVDTIQRQNEEEDIVLDTLHRQHHVCPSARSFISANTRQSAPMRSNPPPSFTVAVKESSPINLALPPPSVEAYRPQPRQPPPLRCDHAAPPPYPPANPTIPMAPPPPPTARKPAPAPPLAPPPLPPLPPRAVRGPPPPPPPQPCESATSSSFASDGSAGDVERKLDALYKLMTRTLSLVQAGGGSIGPSGAPPIEWNGRPTRDAPPQDEQSQAVHDARELMLQELREKVAIRRLALDDAANDS